jgi:hypothetical protein
MSLKLEMLAPFLVPEDNADAVLKHALLYDPVSANVSNESREMLTLGDKVYTGSDARLAANAILGVGALDSVVIELLSRCRTYWPHRYQQLVYQACRVRFFGGVREWQGMELIFRSSQLLNVSLFETMYNMKLAELLLEDLANTSCLRVVLGCGSPMVSFRCLCVMLSAEHPNCGAVIEKMFRCFDWINLQRLQMLNEIAMASQWY